MRWEALFHDLEAQLDEADAAELSAEVAERSRIEHARLRLVDRLRPTVGQPVGIRVLGAGMVHGVLVDVGADWLLVLETGAREVLVPTCALSGVSGLGSYSAQPGSEGVVGARLGFAHALRGLARNRSAVTLVLGDGSVATGTIDRVGADFLELAEHPAGEPRRASRVSALRTIPVAALALVRADY